MGYSVVNVEEIEASCAVGKKLDCKLMCVVGGDDVPGMTQRQMHDHIIAGLKRAVPVVEKHDVTLILEPMNIRVDHKGHCLYGSAPTLRILKAVGSRHVKMLAEIRPRLLERYRKLSDADLLVQSIVFVARKRMNAAAN